ncbi:MAG: PAS domain S-box protein [Rhizomicrobium sp.]
MSEGTSAGEEIVGAPCGDEPVNVSLTQLTDSEHNFRLLVQSVTDYAIYMLDSNGTVASWNAGAERIKGYSAPEIIGKRFSEFFTAPDREAGVPDMALNIARETGTL